MATKNGFSIYRNKILIGKKLGQVAAHKLAKDDAKRQISSEKKPIYFLKGTFANGVNDARIGELKHGRIYWKFVK